MAWNRKAPYDEHGNLMHYPMDLYMGEWRPVAEFKATLSYNGYRRGRSAAYLLFVDVSDETQYPMFMTEADDVIPLLREGRVTGAWTVTKRGQNYGIKYAGPA